MKTEIDTLVKDLAHKHQVSTGLVTLLVNGAMLRTKLAVLGATVVDKRGKVDVKDSCEKLVTEVLNLTYTGANLEIKDSGVAHEPKQEPAQTRLINLAQEVEEAMNPIINHYFLGIEPGRKPS